MASKFHKKAIARITPERRALMVKSLEILSRIHAILDRNHISQKRLAEMLEISQPAVSKMLSPGGNLEMHTIVKLELLLGENILVVAGDHAANDVANGRVTSMRCYRKWEYMEAVYVRAETTLQRIAVSGN
jgi:predicted transcriptional regulator